MAQGESSLSRRIAASWRARGGFVFKVHGGPTMMNGLPDLVGCYRGVSVWIETKMPEGKPPTPVQRLRHKQIRASGGIVAVARSVPQAMAVLDRIDASMDI